MAEIEMSRIYAPENENGERDVLYPETNSESVITREYNNRPITLKDDIGPKIVVGTVQDKDKPSVAGRAVLNIQTVEGNVPNIKIV